LQKYFKAQSVNRILDANINRTKEGLRVCEEIARFVLNSRKLTEDFKILRHEVDVIVKHFGSLNLCKTRSSLDDVGKEIYANELKRKCLKDIFFANIQRVKESIRVLEEFTKLTNSHLAVKIKKIRYAIYETEKKTAEKIARLRNN